MRTVPTIRVHPSSVVRLFVIYLLVCCGCWLVPDSPTDLRVEVRQLGLRLEHDAGEDVVPRLVVQVGEAVQQVRQLLAAGMQ